MERRAVEDDVRVHVGEGAVESGRVRDVELGAIENARVWAKQGRQIEGELTPAARDQSSHRTDANDSTVGFTACRSSSQRMLYARGSVR